MQQSDLVLVYTTHSSEKEAEVLAEKLLRQKLIVCANIFPPGKSVYTWNGGIQIDSEVFAILKTDRDTVEKLEKAYLEAHPYETPCFVVINTDEVSKDYLNWAKSSLKPN